MCCRQEENLEGYMVGYLLVVQVRAAQSWLAVDRRTSVRFHSKASDISKHILAHMTHDQRVSAVMCLTVIPC